MTDQPSAEPTVREAMRLANLLPPEWQQSPALVLAVLAEQYALAVQRMVNDVVRAKIVEIEGTGTFPEQSEIDQNLKIELSPNGLTAWVWKETPILTFSPAGFEIGAPGTGIKWRPATVDLLSAGAKLRHVGQS